ncbi:MAG: response regulator [Candidatus Desulfatibia sp.]|jgi:DNA-binding response OmpR family regulator|uniref:response regulator n=1 Tax=Candidatus Desulfatibia sp. TaxID=3101189 RepID=UPI002F2E7034
MRILIAEDDFTSRRLLKAVLAKWGYDVVSARDGHEAWEKLQSVEAPKLAVLDWMMPKMDGIEVCYRIRQMEKTIPTYIILLTARDGKKDIVRGLEAGADDYIAKPFDNNELRARINVGRRIVELQAALVEKEKLQGVIEMAGAVCHELNQPMQVILGLSELFLDDLDDNHIKDDIKEINAQVKRLGRITKKLSGVTKYKTKDYLTSKIIDLDKAAE